MRKKKRLEVLEVRTLLAGARWLLRSRQRIGCRQAILLDSRVVRGAIQKGRSSAGSLHYLFRQLTVLTTVSGLRFHALLALLLSFRSPPAA